MRNSSQRLACACRPRLVSAWQDRAVSAKADELEPGRYRLSGVKTCSRDCVHVAAGTVDPDVLDQLVALAGGVAGDEKGENACWRTIPHAREGLPEYGRAVASARWRTASARPSPIVAGVGVDRALNGIYNCHT